MFMRHFVRTAAIAFGIFVVECALADADTLTYNFVTSNTPYGIITTSLPASPTPLSSTSDSFQIDVPLIVDGDPMTLPVDFFDAAAGGGAEGDGMRFTGPVLFSGLTTSPTFLTGTFGFGDFTLTIYPAPALTTVPEPATLVLFGTGILICYWLARKRFTAQSRDRTTAQIEPNQSSNG
jgi:hypothetical protein